MSDNDTPLHCAAALNSNQKVIALLLSRGAVDGPSVDPMSTSLYLRKIRAAGGFANYAKQHRAKLVAMLAPKFAHLLRRAGVSVDRALGPCRPPLAVPCKSKYRTDANAR